MNDTPDTQRLFALGRAEGIAEIRLGSPYTTEMLSHQDGSYCVRVFHTIDETYPFEAVLNDVGTGMPYYREVIECENSDGELTSRHMVVRKRVGRPGETIIWEDELGEVDA